MKLHCLGTTGFHPSPSRHTACYYLPEADLVLDAGTGIFRLVEKLLESPKQSLTILLSHAHLDHTVGLTFLLDAMAATELSHLRIVGESEKLAAVREHLYHHLLFPVAPTMEFVALDGNKGQLNIGDARVTYFPLEHPGGSVGYVLDLGTRRLAYVTDTVARPDAEYLDQIRDASLLLHECYFDDQQQALAEKTGHSWLSAVEEVVRDVRPQSTLLIHINPLAEILNTDFALNQVQVQQLKMQVATDGQTVEF